MNKFKIGDRVSNYSLSNTLIGAVERVDDDFITIKLDEPFIGNQCFVSHYKACRRLVKKKRECPHPHITREKLTEAWDKHCYNYYMYYSVDSELFKRLVEELGL